TAAAVFGRSLEPGPIALGRDCRGSSPVLHSAVLAGLTGTGRSVIDLGVCPTPTVALAIRSQSLAGGVMVTASHNPPAWNGLKFFSHDGAALGTVAAQRLRSALRSPRISWVRWDRTGKVIPDSKGIKDHIAQILTSPYFQGRRRRRLKIGIDACNGSASLAAIELVRALGCRPHPLFCSTDQNGRFPRRPEPEARHLSALCEQVRREHLDLGAAFDPDGDRFSCVDERGEALGEEATVMIATEFILKQTAGPVVVNLSTTQGVEDIARRYGVPVYRSRVGEAAVIELMRQKKAVVGGEGNGGTIVPAINWARDGLVALAVVAQALSDTGTSLSSLAQSLPRYYMLKLKTNLPRDSWKVLVRRVLDQFPGAKVDVTDGLRLSLDGSWVHVRPSNTEPIVRIVSEAPTKSECLRLVSAVRRGLDRSKNRQKVKQ
ncbi:MAG: phosphoglucosamine mutase, partial [candidate division WOR-3 bacterium]